MNLKFLAVCFVLFFLSSFQGKGDKGARFRFVFAESATRSFGMERHRFVNKRLECVQTYIMDVQGDESATKRALDQRISPYHAFLIFMTRPPPHPLLFPLPPATFF